MAPIQNTRYHSPVMDSIRAMIKKDTIINAILVLGTLAFLFFLVRVLGEENLKAYVESAGAWAWLALILAKASTMVFAPLSGALLYPLAGTLFGFWPGFLLALAGDALGGVISFWISRIWGKKIVERMLGEDNLLLTKARDMMGTAKGFFIARALLSPVPEIATYAAGLTKLPFYQFLAIHVALDTVPVAFFVGVGALILEEAHPLIVLLIFGGAGLIGAAAIGAFTYYFATPKEETAAVAAVSPETTKE